MAKKDFSTINTGRSTNLMSSIEQATTQHGQQSTASPEEQAQRAADLKTQGRKGCKAVRINTAYTPENYEYVQTMARLHGQSLTAFVNKLIDKHREQNADLYEQIKAIKEKM